ncbi:MAG: PulJ/GspJ family protein [Acidimicrobiales bacterium]
MLNGRGRSDRDDGFTLLELMTVLAVMGVVLAIAGGTLISLQNATVRTTAMINDEQDASTVLAQMARDIRSAHSLTFPSTTTDADFAMILYENQPSGGTDPIEWVYQPPTAPAVVGTLSREVLDSSLAVTSTRVELSDVANVGVPVFTYYNLFGASIPTGSSTQLQTIQNCTTAVGVDLIISPSPVNGVSNFTESDEVAITDQQQILSAPGNQQCGVYTIG